MKKPIMIMVAIIVAAVLFKLPTLMQKMSGSEGNATQIKKKYKAKKAVKKRPSKVKQPSKASAVEAEKPADEPEVSNSTSKKCSNQQMAPGLERKSLKIINDLRLKISILEAKFETMREYQAWRLEDRKKRIIEKAAARKTKEERADEIKRAAIEKDRLEVEAWKERDRRWEVAIKDCVRK